MYKISYTLSTYTQAPLRFTGTGHVDLDAFDDDSGTYTNEAIAEFYDIEAEKLCRPILEQLGKTYIERNDAEPEADDVSLIRKEHHVSKASKVKPLDISYFWGSNPDMHDSILNIRDGFYRPDYGWSEDATDINNQPYEWNSPKLYQQIPKPDDYLKVCQKEFADEIQFCFGIHADGSPDENYHFATEKLHKMIMLYRNLYDDDWDAETQSWWWQL